MEYDMTYSRTYNFTDGSISYQPLSLIGSWGHIQLHCMISKQNHSICGEFCPWKRLHERISNQLRPLRGNWIVPRPCFNNGFSISFGCACSGITRLQGWSSSSFSLSRIVIYWCFITASQTFLFRRPPNFLFGSTHTKSKSLIFWTTISMWTPPPDQLNHQSPIKSPATSTCKDKMHKIN